MAENRQNDEGLFKQLVRQYGGYALALGLCVALVIAANLLFRHTDPVEEFLRSRPDSEEVLGLFQNKSQVATTEVQVRRMGIYDSETRIGSINPTRWKIGRRACILPVDITIKYGIDMKKMKAEDISIDTTNTVSIRLPKPELIDYKVNLRTDRREVVTMSGWLRDEVGEQTIQKVKNKVVNEVLTDSVLFATLNNEIEMNTRALFRSMLMQMGLKPVFTN